MLQLFEEVKIPRSVLRTTVYRANSFLSLSNRSVLFENRTNGLSFGDLRYSRKIYTILGTVSDNAARSCLRGLIRGGWGLIGGFTVLLRSILRRGKRSSIPM